MKGIPFKKFEVNFTYSFLWRFNSFKRLVHDFKNIIEKTKLNYPKTALRDNTVFENPYEACDHVFMDIEKIYESWNAVGINSNFEKNKFYWSIGTHPDRLGLAPLMHFDTPQNQHSSRDITEISCYYRSNGPIEIRSGISEEKDFHTESYSKESIGLELDGWDVLIRISDNGEGVATFKFVLYLDTFFQPSWNEEKRVQQAEMHDKLGCMPFIFSVLTLGRTEHNKTRKNKAPLSKLRVISKDCNSFESLYGIFYKILFQNVLATLCPEAISEPENKNSYIESMDLHIMSPTIDPAAYHPEMWQSPYVCMFATLDNECKSKNKPSIPWWCEGISNLQYGLRSANQTKKGNDVRNLITHYKQTILLLLRLYQWRDFLNVNNFVDGKDISPINLDNVPIPPELMDKSSGEYLFKDIDLVWDGRYLLLYHERSTLVMTTVHDKEDSTAACSFKNLLRQSLLRSLESVRSQWHGALVLAIVIDDLIDELGHNTTGVGDDNNESNIKILQRTSQLRYLYAKLLRDPLAIETDAAALAEVRRKAENTYELCKLTNALKDKFTALTGLLNNQSVLKNLQILQKRKNI